MCLVNTALLICFFVVNVVKAKALSLIKSHSLKLSPDSCPINKHDFVCSLCRETNITQKKEEDFYIAVVSTTHWVVMCLIIIEESIKHVPGDRKSTKGKHLSSSR